MKRKLIFYNFIVFFFLFFIFDVLLSNFYLDKKNKSCYIIEKNFYSFKKNCSGAEQFKPSFPVVDIFTNSLGLRSKSSKMKIDYQKEKIFLFGDSFTFGLGVNYENSFAGILEEKFLKYQFFNFAVPSYSPSLYSYQLKQAINDNLIPKKIFLFLDLTDVYDEGARWQAEDITEKPELIHDEFKKKNFKKKFTHKHFQFSRQLASSINFNLRKLRTKIKIFVSDDYNEVKTSFQANFTYKDIKMLNKIFWDEKKFKKGIKNRRENKNFFIRNIFLGY